MVGLEALGVVDEAIEDGIGEGGIADDIVPGFDGVLVALRRSGPRSSRINGSTLVSVKLSLPTMFT